MHRKQSITAAAVVMTLTIVVSLACSTTGGVGSPTGTPTVTLTPIPRPPIDFNATVMAATLIAEGGYIVTSTPLPVWPTATSVPFNRDSFLATINAQFAHATETAQALATPTPSATATRVSPPPYFLPPAGGSAPGNP